MLSSVLGVCTMDKAKIFIFISKQKTAFIAFINELGDRLIYKQGVTDPDYCVLKFNGVTAEYYCDLMIEKIEL